MLAVIVSAGELLSGLKIRSADISIQARVYTAMHVFFAQRTSRGNTRAVEINWCDSDLQNFNGGRIDEGRRGEGCSIIITIYISRYARLMVRNAK